MTDWKPAKSAPWGEVIEVRNEQVTDPWLATRGYAPNGVVNPDRMLFTSVDGHLCCPTEWRAALTKGAE